MRKEFLGIESEGETEKYQEAKEGATQARSSAKGKADVQSASDSVSRFAGSSFWLNGKFSVASNPQLSLILRSIRFLASVHRISSYAAAHSNSRLELDTEGQASVNWSPGQHFLRNEGVEC
ncbi:hypothetical protein R1flu_027180 [Riccia fluitans]|uniref:Uncharacterized protein n=1 Tax=Riccia fluitans TaxID=41844 RepID=A0ABD1XI24_9MARC